VRSISDPCFDALFTIITFLPRLVLKPLLQSSTSAAKSSTIAADVVANATSIPSRTPGAVARLTTAIGRHWVDMAFIDDTFHRSLCVALGYFAFALAGIMYLQSTTTPFGQNVSRAIREGIKQQLTLLKVCLFIFVEVRFS
jgi:hypothetical protein